eukprot:COSAG05_NODE_17615_length_322_cov_1.080717_1_plen_69_part_01
MLFRYACCRVRKRAWWERWLHRPHFFDGCLDLHLAVAAVNIGRFYCRSSRLQMPTAVATEDVDAAAKDD